MKKTITFILSLLMLLSLTAPALAAGEDAAARGLTYLQGKDYANALNSFLEAERAGNTEVFYPLGEMYEYGTGVKKDLVSAVKYYIRAADAGSAEAQEKLRNEPYKSIAEAMSVQEQATHVPGTYGDVEGVRGPTYPYYLTDYPLVNLRRLTLWFMLEEIYGGIPYGNMYLYVRDPNGDWHHTAMFKLDKTIGVGQPVIFNLTLDQAETVTAFAICPADKGMDFTVRRNVIFFVPGENVGEYSAQLPRPSFTPAQSENPVSFTHVATQSYKNPFAAFSDLIDDNGLFFKTSS